MGISVGIFWKKLKKIQKETWRNFKLTSDFPIASRWEQLTDVVYGLGKKMTLMQTEG